MYKKILAFIMALCLVLAAMPMAFATEVAAITDETGLIEAAATGGEYTLDTFMDVQTGPITVTKDLTLNLSATLQMMSIQADALFIVRGATLTINGASGAEVVYYGAGSTFVLQDGAALELNGGNYTAYATAWGDSYYPTSLVAAASGTTALFDGGGFATQVQTGSHYLGGTLLIGEGTLTVQTGVFHVDPSAYVAEGGVAIQQLDQWQVLEVAAEYGAEFSAVLNENNELVVKRYQPTREEGIDLLVDALSMAYTYEVDGMEYPRFAFHGSTYDFDNGTMYISLLDESWNLTETHLIQLVFAYDAAIKEQVDALIETLPEGSYDEEGWYEPYYYAVNDLELFNYWMNCTEENDWFNINSLINYSDEFKKKIDYKNFRLDTRAGDGDYFYTLANGIADFKYNDTVYASTEMGVRADHILYVPDETEDTADAMLAAVQKRLDDYFGTGKIAVEALTAEEQAEIGYEGYGFKTVINESPEPYYFLAERKSEKMVTPTYQSVDVSTAVAVLTEDASVPLDTMVKVDKLTEGAEYEEIMSVLDVEEHETYDIQLHSGSKGGFVTSLENGEFEVRIPISEDLQDKDLTVYYVNESGTAEEHAVTVKDGNATFTTDHFSIYTLAATGESTHTHSYAWDAESKQYLCSCGTAYVQELDLNGDDSADMKDAILLLRTVDGLNTGIAAYAADINTNGKVNVFDAVCYLQLMNE